LPKALLIVIDLSLAWYGKNRTLGVSHSPLGHASDQSMLKSSATVRRNHDQIYSSSSSAGADLFDKRADQDFSLASHIGWDVIIFEFDR